jgi:hypothetical protein
MEGLLDICVETLHNSNVIDSVAGELDFRKAGCAFQIYFFLAKADIRSRI